jgi:S-adenosylmethionine hydrolase
MITLTTDFGLLDPYAAEMKGVILTVNPEATVIDITHNVEKFNIRMAAFVLASAAPYFPKGTVHLAVVDPGVGTKRRAIIVQTKQSFFVGPDNGVLMLSAQSQGIERIHEISNPNLILPQTSNTFHGRDIFAPAAAHLDKGVHPKEFGEEVKNPVLPQFSAVEQSKDMLTGEVLHIDNFGNIITNIKERNVPKATLISMKLPQTLLKAKFVKVYEEAEPEEPIILVGSHGFIELAINQGNAAEKFHAKVGDKIVVTAV